MGTSISRSPCSTAYTLYTLYTLTFLHVTCFYKCSFSISIITCNRAVLYGLTIFAQATQVNDESLRSVIV